MVFTKFAHTKNVEVLQIWGLAGVKPLFVSTLKVKRETKLQQETEIGDLGYSAGPSHVVFYFERSSVSVWEMAGFSLCSLSTEPVRGVVFSELEIRSYICAHLPW